MEIGDVCIVITSFRYYKLYYVMIVNKLVIFVS